MLGNFVQLPAEQDYLLNNSVEFTTEQDYFRVAKYTGNEFPEFHGHIIASISKYDPLYRRYWEIERSKEDGCCMKMIQIMYLFLLVGGGGGGLIAGGLCSWDKDKRAYQIGLLSILPVALAIGAICWRYRSISLKQKDQQKDAIIVQADKKLSELAEQAINQIRLRTNPFPVTVGSNTIFSTSGRQGTVTMGSGAAGNLSLSSSDPQSGHASSSTPSIS